MDKRTEAVAVAVAVAAADKSWFHDAIVYHILVDRFAGYDPAKDPLQPVFPGGNLNGISEKLDYLVDLGINAIWLSPVNQTNAYHGYHITDFYTTDNRFGTEDELKNLIENAHRKNIRVILDFVPNHCSVQHPYFRHDLETAMRNHYQRFPDDFFLPSFLENHDMNRFLYDAGQNREKLKRAIQFQMSLPQPPILYYGTETGMTHEDPVQGHVRYSDILATQRMPWDALDREMIDFCSEMIWKRRKSKRL